MRRTRWSGKRVDAHRVALAVPDFGGGLEEEAGAFSGGKNDIDVAGLCCGACGGLQTRVDGLKEVRLDEVVANVTGGADDGFKSIRVLWEVRVYEGGEKGPAGVLCAVDADCVDAGVLVEEGRVHVQAKSVESVLCHPMSNSINPQIERPPSLPLDSDLPS